MATHVLERILESHAGQDAHGNGQSSGPTHARCAVSDHDLTAAYS